MKKKKLYDELGEEIYETESAEWYAVKGKLHPEKWNWKDIKREWNKLGMPKDVAYDLFHIPLQYEKRCGYYMLISKRGVGKTTSVLLLGMILYKLYGVKIQYIRQSKDMLAPKFAQEAFSTIIQPKLSRVSQAYFLNFWNWVPV